MGEIDPRSVNVILCIAIQGGIRIAFEVQSASFVEQKSSVELLELLRTSIVSLCEIIATKWKLSDNEPIVIQTIDLVEKLGDFEELNNNNFDHEKQKKRKNPNFSLQVKRSSISSNRFFSVDINGNRSNENSMYLGQTMNNQQIQKTTSPSEEYSGVG